MARRLFPTLSVISLVLLLAVVVMCVRSYRVGEAIIYGRRLGDDLVVAPTRAYALASTHGVVGASVVGSGPALVLNFREGWRYERWEPKPPRPVAPEADDRVNVSFLEFQVLHRVSPAGTSNTYVQVPYWFICLALGGPPVLWLRSKRGR